MIGTIADDFTGATDVAVALRRAGLRTLIFFDPPADTAGLPAHDAIVIALKSRTTQPGEAVRDSRLAFEALRANGVRQVYYKFCSTFDSTPRGNIGPVLDMLADETGADTVVLTPSSPEHGRTQYLGHLFVDGELLAESPMRHHPLTPMTDSNLLRLLADQTKRRVGLVPLRTVHDGVDAVSAAIEQARRGGVRYLIVDAVASADLETVGRALRDAPLVAGAAGLAGGLAAAAAAGRSAPADTGDPFASTRAAVLAGSCSAMTLQQIDHLRMLGRPAHRLDALAEPDPARLAAKALAWYDSLPGEEAPLIYSSVEPARLAQIQARLGVERSAAVFETATGLIARGLVARGVRRIVSAGGETSGEVVSALGVRGGLIGPEVAVGVPWIYSTNEPRVALLLKSGNFGGPELLATASAGSAAEAA
ncbi:3-oxo-tetronate kinase [Saccharomonospora sp. NPDC046836]|uniref:3-oxo-tetronate kinase n=1 Tax=Saccharomonospora sp. NPDC046836 TaxID=3156921 RepID=UPI0033CB2BBC